MYAFQNCVKSKEIRRYYCTKSIIKNITLLMENQDFVSLATLFCVEQSYTRV